MATKFKRMDIVFFRRIHSFSHWSRIWCRNNMLYSNVNCFIHTQTRAESYSQARGESTCCLVAVRVLTLVLEFVLVRVLVHSCSSSWNHCWSCSCSCSQVRSCKCSGSRCSRVIQNTWRFVVAIVVVCMRCVLYSSYNNDLFFMMMMLLLMIMMACKL